MRSVLSSSIGFVMAIDIHSSWEERPTKDSSFKGDDEYNGVTVLLAILSGKMKDRSTRKAVDLHKLHPKNRNRIILHSLLELWDERNDIFIDGMRQSEAVSSAAVEKTSTQLIKYGSCEYIPGRDRANSLLKRIKSGGSQISKSSRSNSIISR
jgi:hypothetical protein